MSDYKQQTNEAFFENSIKNSPFNSYPPHLTKDVEAFFEKHINLNWDNLFVTEKKEDFQLEEDFKKTKLSQLIDSYDSYDISDWGWNLVDDCTWHEVIQDIVDV